MRPKKSDVRRSMMAERIAAKGSCSAQELANEFWVPGVITSSIDVFKAPDDLEFDHF